jgi:hypothetical protein
MHKGGPLLAASVAATTLVLCAPSARAHFALEAPSSWMSQDAVGLPEKLGPCGDEYDGTDAATPTGIVTTFQEGQTITVTVDELIFHPGHYRIALAVHDRSELPAEPVVTPADTPCGSAAIENPAVFPVLADGVFDHTAAFGSPQSVQITLPAGVTCTKCTLQVIEFMGEHPLNSPGGCFYHHCADIAIVASAADAGAGVDAAGSPAGPGAQAGCGCRAAGDRAKAAPWAAALVAMLLVGRRVNRAVTARGWRGRGRGRGRDRTRARGPRGPAAR